MFRYRKVCDINDRVGVTSLLERFISEVERLPSISLIDMSILIDKTEAQINNELRWSYIQEECDEGNGNLATVLTHNESKDVSRMQIRYHIYSPNRNPSVCLQICRKTVELVNEGLLIRSNTLIHLSGESRFGLHFCTLRTTFGEHLELMCCKPPLIGILTGSGVDISSKQNGW